MSKIREIQLPNGQALTGWTVEEASDGEDFYIDPEILEEIKQRIIESIENTKNNQDAEQK